MAVPQPPRFVDLAPGLIAAVSDWIHLQQLDQIRSLMRITKICQSSQYPNCLQPCPRSSGRRKRSQIQTANMRRWNRKPRTFCRMKARSCIRACRRRLTRTGIGSRKIGTLSLTWSARLTRTSHAVYAEFYCSVQAVRTPVVIDVSYFCAVS